MREASSLHIQPTRMPTHYGLSKMTTILKIILCAVICCTKTVHSFQYHHQQQSRFAAGQITRRLQQGEQYSTKEEKKWRSLLAARPTPWDDEEDDSIFFRDDNRRGGGPRYRSDPRERPQPPRPTGPRGEMDFPRRGRRRKEEEESMRNGPLASPSSYDDPGYEFFDDEDDMFEEEDEEEGGGNYWSNPPGRYDRPPQQQQQQARRGGRRMPRPNDPPRARRRPPPQSGEKMRRNYNGRPRKTTFRSGTPPPPPVVGDFYKQLFWYGFDPDDSSSPADKTMFGGTKGKFNGLSYLYDEDPNELERRRRRGNNNYDDKSPPPGRRPRQPPPPRMRDEYDDYDDEDGTRFDERDDDDMPACYYDDQSTSKHYFVTPPNDAPFIRVEENLRPEFRQTPPQSPPRQRQRRRDKQNLWQGGDIMGSEDGYAYNGRSSRDSVRGGGGGGGPGGSGGGDWAAKKVASWFRDWEEGDNYIGLRDDQYEEELPPSGRRGRQRGPVDNSSPWPPNVDIFTSFFGRPSRDMERQAEMYDRQMGIGANAGRRGVNANYERNGSRRPPSTPPPPSPRQERRKGYAYRYDKDEEDDGAIVDADVVVSDVSDVDDTTSEEVESQSNKADPNQGNKQSVQPNGSVEQPKQPNSKQQQQQAQQGQEEDMQSKQTSWEHRQLVRERIPPPGVQAWGPNGDLGMDARMKAYTDAMQDVRDAEYDLEQKRNLKEDAIEAIEILRVDIGMATRRLAKNPREKANLRDLELKLDQAQYRFRRTRDQEKFAQERLSELKDWYGPLLGLYNPTQAEQTVDSALQDFQQDEPAARRDQTTSSNTVTPDTYD